MASMQNLTSLAKELISLKSNPDNPTELKRVLECVLLRLRGFTIEKFKKNEFESALIYNSPKRPKKFKVMLNAHLDVIPGKAHQYHPRLKGNKLYGVGAMDMKASASVLVEVFKRVAAEVSYPLGLQLVTDEEIGGFYGTQHQLEKGVRAEFIIAGEPTNLNIAHQAKGILQLKITSKGKSAHGAYPWRGENAIWKMNRFLDQLKEKIPISLKDEWITTLNLARISTTNNSFNKIPDNCEVWLDIRFIPGDDKTVVRKVKSILPKEFELDIMTHEPSLFTAQDNEFIQKLVSSCEKITGASPLLYGAQGSSDARHYGSVGGAGVEFGPIGGGIGEDDEWVNVKSLETYSRIVEQFLLDL
jgi:succinyl-diaminopimelate desuccinylase